MKTDNFAYNSGTFIWFTGVVEDIQDPKELGRVRVRCYGYHSDRLDEIPTDTLPWATVLNPIQSPSHSKIGHSATGILNGTWVVGFFRDGSACQDPLILGTIPSQSTLAADKTKGFNDPNGIYPIIEENINDQPLQATQQFKTAPSYIKREELIGIGNTDKSTPVPITFPDISDAPIYPNNKVVSTPKGHVFEVDDTDKAERLLDYHCTGTFNEIRANGDSLTIINGDSYRLVVKGDNVRIQGVCNVHIGGNANTHVEGDYNLTVDGNYTETIKGAQTSNVTGDVSESILGKQTTRVTGNIKIDGKIIDLNKG